MSYQLKKLCLFLSVDTIFAFSAFDFGAFILAIDTRPVLEDVGEAWVSEACRRIIRVEDLVYEYDILHVVPRLHGLLRNPECRIELFASLRSGPLDLQP